MSMEVVGLALVIAISVASALITRRLAVAFVRSRAGVLVGMVCIYTLSSMFALSYTATSLVGLKSSTGVGVVSIVWAGYLLGYFFYCAFKQPAQ